MPKQKITKDMVVEAAFEIARADGMDHVLVKNIAEKLDCSVQPIYSYCESMEGLRRNVVERAGRFMRAYLEKCIDRSDFFRSTGRAYVKLAKEEPHVFQMFIMHRRENVFSLDDLYRMEASADMADIIAESLCISAGRARDLHLNMLIYTTGIGTILATAAPGIDKEEIFDKLEEACQAFKRQALSSGGDGDEF